MSDWASGLSAYEAAPGARYLGVTSPRGSSVGLAARIMYREWVPGAGRSLKDDPYGQMAGHRRVAGPARARALGRVSAMDPGGCGCAGLGLVVHGARCR